MQAPFYGSYSQPDFVEVDEKLGLDGTINSHMSKGNFFKDLNGNVLLDLNCRNEGLSLGHNHNALVHGVKNDILRRIIYHYVRVPPQPTDDHADFVR